MFTKILVGVDGSNNSMRALDHALFLKKKFGSSLTVVHVVALPLATYGENPSVRFLERLETRGREILCRAKQLANKRRMTVKTLIVKHPDPANEILALSEKDGFDLIVLGSRGLSGIRKFLMGSVSTKVTEHAKCAVLTVK